MATLTALYTRVILQTNRDDMGSGGALEQAKIDAVAQAVEDYSDWQFWFNRASGTGNTSASTATIAMPTGIRTPEVVTYLGAALNKVPLNEIEYRTETGIPSLWAEDEGTIHFWPIPNGTYAIYVYGTASTGVPASGSDSNIWTTEAYDLIVAATCKRLYRDYFRDVDGATLAQVAEDRALAKLQRETRRRDIAPMYSDVPRSRYDYDINRG